MQLEKLSKLIKSSNKIKVEIFTLGRNVIVDMTTDMVKENSGNKIQLPQGGYKWLKKLQEKLNYK